MKLLAFIPAAVLMAAPVQAYEFDAELTLGDATDIRACPIDGDYSRGVCYNQRRSLGFPLFTIDRNRAYSVDCERRFYSENTVKGQVAEEFCPVQGELEFAPFL